MFNTPRIAHLEISQGYREYRGGSISEASNGDIGPAGKLLSAVPRRENLCKLVSGFIGLFSLMGFSIKLAPWIMRETCESLSTESGSLDHSGCKAACRHSADWTASDYSEFEHLGLACCSAEVSGLFSFQNTSAITCQMTGWLLRIVY